MKQLFRPVYLLTLLALLLAAVAVGCGGSDSDSSAGTEAVAEGGDKSTLRVGVLPGWATKQQLEASGELAKLGYEIEFQEYPGAGPQWMEAARGGATDIAMMTETPLIFGQAASSPVKAVAATEWMKPGDSLMEIVVPEDSEIKSVADLKGKSVTAPEGQFTQYYVQKALEAEGLSLDDVKPINLSLADAVTSYKAGQIDALADADPYLTPMLQEGNRSISRSDEVTPTPLLFWAVTEDTLESNPEQIEGFIAAMKRAEEWSDANPEEWGKIYGEALGLDPKTGQEVVERRMTNYVDIDQKVIQASQEEADVFAESGILPEPVDVSEEFDDRFNGIFSGGGE